MSDRPATNPPTTFAIKTMTHNMAEKPNGSHTLMGFGLLTMVRSSVVLGVAFAKPPL